jgi:replicative DNA helicase
MEKVIQSKPSVNASVKLRQDIAENVLTLLCLSEHGKLISALVSPQDFTNEIYRTFATRALDYWKKYKRPPGRALTADLVGDILGDKNNKRAKAFRQVLVNMVVVDHEGINAEYVLDSVRSLQRLSALTRATMQAAELIESRGEHAIGEVENMWGNALRDRQSNLAEGLWGSDVEALVAHINSRAVREFKTDIPELDRCGVVPTRRTLMTMLAPSGFGKSWFLTHVARCALYARHKVLYVTLEMDKADVMQRFYQSFGVLALREPELDITLSRMQLENEGLIGFEDQQVSANSYLEDNPQVLAALQDVRDCRKQYFRNLRVDDFAALTVARLEAHLDQLEVAHGFVPDLLCLDYLGKLETAGREDYRVELGQETSDLVALMKERNIAGVTAQQVNREGQTAKLVNRTHIAEDISIVTTSDFVLTLSRNEKERRHGLARIWVDKARHAVDNFGVVVGQNLQHGQFVRKDQSTRWTPAYEEHFKRLPEAR